MNLTGHFFPVGSPGSSCVLMVPSSVLHIHQCTHDISQIHQGKPVVYNQNFYQGGGNGEWIVGDNEISLVGAGGHRDKSGNCLKGRGNLEGVNTPAPPPPRKNFNRTCDALMIYSNIPNTLRCTQDIPLVYLWHPPLHL